MPTSGNRAELLAKKQDLLKAQSAINQLMAIKTLSAKARGVLIALDEQVMEDARSLQLALGETPR